MKTCRAARELTLAVSAWAGGANVVGAKKHVFHVFYMVFDVFFYVFSEFFKGLQKAFQRPFKDLIRPVRAL